MVRGNTGADTGTDATTNSAAGIANEVPNASATDATTDASAADATHAMYYVLPIWRLPVMHGVQR